MKPHYYKLLYAFATLALICSCTSKTPAPYVDKGDMVFSRSGQKHKDTHAKVAHKPAENTAFDSAPDQYNEISETTLQPIEETEHKHLTIAEEKHTPPNAKAHKDSFNKDISLKKEEDGSDRAPSYDARKLTDIDLEKQIDNRVAQTASNTQSAQPQANGSAYKLKSPFGSSKFDWPVEGKVLSHYGKLGNKFNEGINISAPLGSPVAAASDGKVVYIGNNVEGYGNLLIIRHDGDIMSAYAHLKDIVVERGATIKRGESIGSVGQVGNVTQPQLHFSIRKGKKTIDPELPLG